MNRTIEEIRQYFEERPELWAKIDEELAKDRQKDKSMSICEWGESLKKESLRGICAQVDNRLH